LRLNLFTPTRFYFCLAVACRDAGRCEEAIAVCKKAAELEPDSPMSQCPLASCYALTGREEKVHAEAAEVLGIDPDFSVDYLCKRLPYKYDVDRNLVRESLRKAGLT